MSTITNQDVNSNSNIINNDNFDVSLYPAIDNTFDLGSATLRWRDLFLGTQLIVSAGSNQAVFGSTHTTTLNFATPSANRVYSIPDTGANSSFVMTDLTQTINGTKTFSSAINSTASSNQFVFNSSNTGPITLNAGNSANLGGWTCTLPDARQASSFVLTSLALGSQMISAPTIFSASVGLSSNYINLTNVSNQLVLGTTNKITINAAAPAASQVYTIPDTGTTSSFIMTDGTQSINGELTLTNSTQSSHFNGFAIANNASYDNMFIKEATSPSHRAGIYFGGDGSGSNGWEIIQDTANNGTRNFAIFNDNAGNTAISIDPSTSNITCVGTITANGFSSTTNQTDYELWMPASSLTYSGSTWTLTRSGNGLYYMQKTTAADTSYVVCQMPISLRTTSNKGYKLTSFIVAYNVQTAALTSATPNIYNTGLSDNQAVLNTTTVSLTGSLTLTTSSNLYYKTITVSSPTFATSNDDTYIEIAFVAQGTTQLIVYGIQLNFTVNYT